MAEDEVNNEDVPIPPAMFITLMMDEEGLHLNIGDIGYYGAVGMLETALTELKDAAPGIIISSTDVVFYSANFDDDEDDDG